MKKILLVVIAIVSFSTITSCDKDDDQASLQGKWEYSQDGFAVNGVEILVAYQHEAGCTKNFSVFSANTIIDYTYFSDDCEETVMTIPFSRSGNTITVGSGEFSATFEIKTLDANTLKLYSVDSEDPEEVYVVVYKRVN
jgi:hypothetical protein